MRYTKFLTYPLLALLLAACNPYQKQIPTGEPKRVDNAYSSPEYDHSKILNVLVLPIENPLELTAIRLQEKEIFLNVLRNFGKFNYFNLQSFPPKMRPPKGIIDLSTGEIDRLKLGEIGREYHAQAVLKVSIQDLQPFSPIRIKLKAALIDTDTAERIWSVDEVFDAQDADVMNGMRLWWNTHIAGATDHDQDFKANQVSPGFFVNYVFYEIARSYEQMRIRNIEAIAKEREKIQKEQERIEQLRGELGNT